MSTPSPFPNTSNPLKAFVLGCDPTAFTKEELEKLKNKQITASEMHPIPLKTVFAIGQDRRYFSGIKANLKQLNIEMDDIYVQNLIPEFRQQESSKDPAGWINDAQLYIPDRVKEFDTIDPARKIPVFLTSELLYKALLNEGQIPEKPIKIYSNDKNLIIPAVINKLFRPLVILYRHPTYSLKKQTVYKEKLQKHFIF
jgi:hypothetical protein